MALHDSRRSYRGLRLPVRSQHPFHTNPPTSTHASQTYHQSPLRYLFTPNIYPLNKKYAHHTPPFFYPNDRLPLLLLLILGFQHALTKISGIITPILAISRGAFYLDAQTSAYLVSAGFITTGIASFLQITRSRIWGTEGYYFGTGVLSVVGPTFDIIPVGESVRGRVYTSENAFC